MFLATHSNHFNVIEYLTKSGGNVSVSLEVSYHILHDAPTE